MREGGGAELDRGQKGSDSVFGKGVAAELGREEGGSGV